jgi:hypothetical protein
MTEKLNPELQKEIIGGSCMILVLTTVIGILALLNKAEEKQIDELCGQDRAQCTEIDLDPFCNMGTCVPQSEWILNKPLEE